MPRINFADYFIKGYQEGTERKRRQEEFAREMAYRNRQLGLLQRYREQHLANQDRDYELDLETTQANTFNNYTEVPEDMANAVSGQSLIDRGTTYGDFSPDKHYLRNDLFPEEENPEEMLLDTRIENGQRVDYFGTSPENITRVQPRNLPSSVLSPKESQGVESEPEEKIYAPDEDSGVAKLDQLVEAISSFYNDKGEFVKDREVDVSTKDGVESVGYKDIKNAADKTLQTAMFRAGVPMEGKVTNFVRKEAGLTGGRWKEIPRQERYKRMNDALFRAQKKYGLQDQQMEVLKKWNAISNDINPDRINSDIQIDENDPLGIR